MTHHKTLSLCSSFPFHFCSFANRFLFISALPHTLKPNDCHNTDCVVNGSTADCITTACNSVSDDKVGIMTTLGWCMSSRPWMVAAQLLCRGSSSPYSEWCWRHQMETLSALLALCAGNSPVSGEFPSQRPVTRSFGVFYDLRLNKRLSK